MIESWLFIFAVFMVLIVPDSRNVILADSAYQQGVWKALKFIPIEVLSYFYGISFWALILHLGLPVWPLFLHILHLASVLYVIWWVRHLWQISSMEPFYLKRAKPKSTHIFLTILKNPKTILFSSGIFPFETWSSFENYIGVLTIFCICFVICSLFWMCFGRNLLLGKIRGVSANHYYKGSALLLILGISPIFLSFLK